MSNEKGAGPLPAQGTVAADNPRGYPRPGLRGGVREKVAVEAIAARVGVGKQPIYRRWPSKSAVAFAPFWL
ncbi:MULTISPECIES: TetR family transcriptional regulator [Streptomyces]|uniref:TetR family transcriptional regulator n=1 Tax=Streptomyces siderophoricus TaxID=2802281 RepID=A0ABS1N081_9ACTN|nr:TetR family transcriptional regulator [Streptomyces sp. 9-7]MBL1093370.1 TetR family transcriptional regulator [Streptomyces sp. 9-7]